jgi:hypothetical protein
LENWEFLSYITIPKSFMVYLQPNWMRPERGKKDRSLMLMAHLVFAEVKTWENSYIIFVFNCQFSSSCNVSECRNICSSDWGFSCFYSVGPRKFLNDISNGKMTAFYLLTSLSPFILSCDAIQFKLQTVYLSKPLFKIFVIIIIIICNKSRSLYSVNEYNIQYGGNLI